MEGFRRLPGLPPYGPMAIPFPSDWGRTGSEGLVVEFDPSDGSTWAGNFEPGLGGLDEVRKHPNGRDVLVASSGSLFQVNADARTAVEIAPAVFSVWEVGPQLVYDNQGIWFLCLDSSGVVWTTQRISWDGFDKIQFTANHILGMAWSPIEDKWLPFEVDLETGVVRGGSFTDEHRRLGIL